MLPQPSELPNKPRGCCYTLVLLSFLDFSWELKFSLFSCKLHLCHPHFQCQQLPLPCLCLPCAPRPSLGSHHSQAIAESEFSLLGKERCCGVPKGTTVGHRLCLGQGGALFIWSDPQGVNPGLQMSFYAFIALTWFSISSDGRTGLQKVISVLHLAENWKISISCRNQGLDYKKVH